MIQPLRFLERLLGRWTPAGATPPTVPMRDDVQFHRPSRPEELRDLPRRAPQEDGEQITDQP